MQSIKQITTKQGERMAFLTIEDASGKAEIIAFPKVFQKAEQWIASHNTFIIKGFLDIASQQACKIKAQHIIPADLILNNEAHPAERIILTLKQTAHEEHIQKLATLCSLEGPSALNIRLKEEDTFLEIKSSRTIALSAELLHQLQELCEDIRIII